MSLRFFNRFVKPSNLNNIRSISTNKILREKEYLPNEEWISSTNNITKLGITKNAIEQMGEIVYVDYILENNDVVSKDDEIVVIESVKATESILAPFDCKIIENNLELVENLDYLNESSECEDNSWILKLEKL